VVFVRGRVDRQGDVVRVVAQRIEETLLTNKQLNVIVTGFSLRPQRLTQAENPPSIRHLKAGERI
jgi:hypothetical protein